MTKKVYPKRIAIVGTREEGWTEAQVEQVKEAVRQFVYKLSPNTIIISGGASGVDTWAEKAALERHMEVKVYRAAWGQYGQAAGRIRNRKIVNNCTDLYAFWNGKSGGTKHSINLAEAEGKLREVIRYDSPN